MGEINVGQVSAKPGTRACGYLGHLTLGSGIRVGVPAVIVNGARPGPVLTLVSGVHGPELTGVAAVFKTLEALDPAEMTGAVVACTVANPLAVQLGTYETPVDRTNLSGDWYFPPRPGGGPTQRLAAGISPALELADCVLDVHANAPPAMAFAITNLSLAPDQATRDRLSRYLNAFGVTAIEWERERPTNIAGSCMARGIAAATIELPGNVHLLPETVAIGSRGILNVMRAMGILPGAPEPQPSPPLPGRYVFAGMLKSNTGGLLFWERLPGQRIEAGEVVARVVDPFGQVREELRMPFTGYVWAYRVGMSGSHLVDEGYDVAYLFREN